jgi:hypothetical protein
MKKPTHFTKGRLMELSLKLMLGSDNPDTDPEAVQLTEQDYNDLDKIANTSHENARILLNSADKAWVAQQLKVIDQAKGN